jgi:formylglycine-generating enzyme required for sulfatase activity
MQRALIACLILTCGGCRAKSLFGDIDAGRSDGLIKVPDGWGSGPLLQLGASTFFMGCDTDAGPDCRPEEMPMHYVQVSAYDIDQHEVTQGEYSICTDSGNCSAPAAFFDPAKWRNRPVTNVTWFQAKQYCEWAGKRLPTEAEWESAATGNGGIYPWGNAPPDCTLANYLGCSGDLADVGAQPAGKSWRGADDLAGNVWEWVDDWYAASYYAASPAVDPRGPDAGTAKVKKGGSFHDTGDILRSSYRVPFDPNGQALILGFRCAKTP